MAEKNLGDLRTKFKLDTESIDKLAKSVKGVRGDFEWLSKNLTQINSKLDKTLKALQGIQKLGGLQGGGGGSPTGAGIQLPLGPANNNSTVQANTTDARQAIQNVIINQGGNGSSGGGGAGGGGRFGRTGGAALQALSAGIQALDNRINNNYERSLSVDKLGVYYQQNRGITQQQYYNQMRKPLQDQRLGYGGINTLLSLQASTGLEASKQAGGIAGLRAMSGYSYSTGDMANMVNTLSSAQVNNRMTMMLGTGIYGVGGEQRGIDTVIRDITKNSGLTNAGALKGARQSGSVTRTRLEAMGVPPDMIDMVLDYAESNVSYQKKGGKGMYDPSDKAQRKMMGIEDNFATQAEETARVREGRDEKFYNRQKDNYADMEKGLQAVTKALEAFEEKLSGIVGAGVSTKGGMLRKLGGIGLMAAGMGMGIASGGVLSPLAAGMMGAGGVLVTGDPMPEKKQRSGVTVPMGYSSPARRIPLSQVATTSTFSPLNTTFKNRLLQMIAENPNVGIGEGIRSEGQQKQLFLSRYKKVTDGSEGDAEWNGEQYKHVSGAPAAPPGKSMHEIGLAADLVGDLDWVQENASRFGLKTFGDVNGEPWHIQPAELPNSRWEYEKQGSKWGAPPGTSKGSSGSDTGAYVIGDQYVGKASAGNSATFSTFQGMSLSDQIGSISAENRQAMGGASGRGEHSVRAQSTGRNTSSASQPKGTRSGGAMDPVELATLMYKRGFRGQHLLNMMAIAGRESNWQPGAYNGKGPDRSYGLFQINMIGDLGPARRERYGISSNEELFDPRTNIKAARLEFGDGNYKPWNTDGGPMAKTDSWMQKAKVAAKSAGVDRGDPTFNTPSRGSTSVQVSGGTNVTIAPNIYVTSSGSTQQDARKMAQEIAQIMERELKKELLRNG